MVESGWMVRTGLAFPRFLFVLFLFRYLSKLGVVNTGADPQSLRTRVDSAARTRTYPRLMCCALNATTPLGHFVDDGRLYRVDLAGPFLDGAITCSAAGLFIQLQHLVDLVDASLDSAG